MHISVCHRTWSPPASFRLTDAGFVGVQPSLRLQHQVVSSPGALLLLFLRSVLCSSHCKCGGLVEKCPLQGQVSQNTAPWLVTPFEEG